MSAPSLRTVMGVGVVLAAMLAIEVVGLRSGTAGPILLGVSALTVLVMLALQLELRWIGLAGACGAAFTLTWNGVTAGPLRLGDVLVLAALACFIIADPNSGLQSPPWWIKQLAAALVLLVVLQIYFPPNANYLSHRVVLTAGGQPAPLGVANLTGTNIFVAFKFVGAVAAIPVVFTAAAKVDRRVVRWLAIAFATGTGLSGAVAFADHFGGDLGSLLTGVANIRDRQAGFSDHPNFLAAGLVLAIPIAFWMLLSASRTERLLGAAATAGCIGGVFASGSRGGAVTALVALALSVLAHHRTRAHAPTIAIGSLLAVGIVGGIVPHLGAMLLKVTRLGNAPATAGSDQVRAIASTQGIRDFHQSPFYGIGLQVSTQASQVYLQELASGGLLLFVAMQTYMLSAIVTAVLHMRRNPLAAALLVSLVATLVLNIFEADLTDRFYYLPAAILGALVRSVYEDHVCSLGPAQVDKAYEGGARIAIEATR